MPLGTRFVNNEGYNYQTDIIVGWTVTKEKREKIDNRLIDFAFEGAALNSGTKGSTTGQGGSLARFQIVNNYLYTVASHEMIIFNISNLTKPTLASSLYAGNNIETLFQADGYLYIGSTDGNVTMCDSCFLRDGSGYFNECYFCFQPRIINF